MNRRCTIIIRSIYALLFVTILCFGLIGFVRNTETVDKTSIQAYYQDIEQKKNYVNIYGWFQDLLGKNQIEKFTIFRNSYAKLVAPRKYLDTSEVQEKVKELDSIISRLRKSSTSYLYIIPPLPIFETEDLPYGVEDYSHQNAEHLHKLLYDFSLLNLSDTIDLPKESLFYRTDHHWSGDTAFAAYEVIQNWMAEEGILQEELITSTIGSFSRKTVDGFLGSYGVKVGKYYDGEDQFIYFLPSTDAVFSCYSMDADGKLLSEHTGNWYKALMDSEKLEDPEYNNKYGAALWGNGGENRIINHNLDSGKLLIISHSYGRPLAQYFALDFHEVRQIDPQKGRFNGDYLNYIEEYNPDMVLVLVEWEGEIIGEYKTTV